LAAHSLRRPLQGGQRDGRVGRIEKAIELGAGRVHPLRHRNLAKALLLHRRADRLRDQLLDCLTLYFLADALFVQELREAGADAPFVAFHHSTSFSRFRAKSKSALGVAWVFLIKPCNSTMLPSAIPNKTRPTLPSLRLLRISNNPAPMLRQDGIPIGQPNSALAMSLPIVRGHRQSR